MNFYRPVPSYVSADVPLRAVTTSISVGSSAWSIDLLVVVGYRQEGDTEASSKFSGGRRVSAGERQQQRLDGDGCWRQRGQVQAADVGLSDSAYDRTSV